MYKYPHRHSQMQPVELAKFVCIAPMRIASTVRSFIIYIRTHFRYGKKRDTPKTHFMLKNKYPRGANYRLAFLLPRAFRCYLCVGCGFHCIRQRMQPYRNCSLKQFLYVRTNGNQNITRGGERRREAWLAWLFIDFRRLEIYARK